MTIDIYNDYGGKRAFDIAAASIFLVPAAGISLSWAFRRAHDDLKTHGTNLSLSERFCGKGLFITQDRVGLNQKNFKMPKVKSMRDEEYPNQPNKERTGKVGNRIRSNKGDELPQILSVLKGDMSMVGPRPVLPDHPEAKDDFRHTVRPGILSTAAVLGVRNTLKPELLIRFDHRDIERSSFKNDIKIIQKFWKNRKKIYDAPNNREHPAPD